MSSKQQTPCKSTQQTATKNPSNIFATTTIAATTNGQIKGDRVNNCQDASEPTSWVAFRDSRRKQPTPDPSNPPISQIKFYLDRYRIKEALQIFFDENTLKLLRIEPDFMWDIIPLICKRLRGLNQYRFRVFEGCERMLCRIAVDEYCNPKEVLISLLAEMSQQDEHPDDDNVFRAMIRPLEGTLLRMNHPSPRDENLRWVLNVLLRHINSIEFPQECNLDGKKRLSLPNDPNVKRFIETLPLLLSFIEEINDKPLDLFDKSPMPLLTESQIEEVFNGELVDDDDLISDQSVYRTDSLDVSISALFNLMSKPLAFLDLTSYSTDLRLFANRCTKALIRFKPNLFAPIYKRISQKFYSIESSSTSSYIYNLTGSESDRIGGGNEDATISLANCSYVYRCERTVSFETIQCFPQVMTHESSFSSHLPYIVALLERTEILVHEKGLSLLESFLKQLEPDSLDQKFLDLFESSQLHKQLFRLMVYSPLCTNRKKAYDLFTNLCDLLTHDCKLNMFKYVLNQTDLRPCVRAACIDQYRKHLTNVYRELTSLHQQLTSLAQNSPETGLQKTNSNHEVKNSKTNENISSSTDTSANIESKNNLSDNNNSSKEKVAKPAQLCKKAPLTSTAIMQRMKCLHQRYKALGGSVLIEFLDQCIKACLPDSQHTDIIENYELLLATLTMFRFLKLRHTIFRDEIEEEYLCGKKLKKTFFDPIRNAISLIMNELKLHHKDIVDGHKKKNTKITQNSILNISQSRNEFDLLSRILGPSGKGLEEAISIESSKDVKAKDQMVTITGSDEPVSIAFNEQDETDCLNWALCRLDLVESVLVRTCDLYNF